MRQLPRPLRLAVALVALIVASPLAAPAAGRTLDDETRPWWKRRIDTIVSGRPVGVAVVMGGRRRYGHDAFDKRVPASNQKVLMSMALLEALGPDARLTTSILATAPLTPVLRGDLWIVGTGDPTVTGGGRFGRELPFRPTRLGRLARQIDLLGVERVRGRVYGSTGYFAHDWDAPGWKPSFPAEEVPLPSAVTFEGNVVRGKHVADPERRAAAALTKRLEARGISVRGRPGAGLPPPGATAGVVAQARSVPLSRLLGYMNKTSSNFFAEVLGKRLGVATFGPPGTIARGSAGIAAWADVAGARLIAHDASGLSYSNRVSPNALVRLLEHAAGTAWGRPLRRGLAAPGEGTLEDRLAGVKVRAKTGTLDQISALCGYVTLGKTGEWASFAILSRGMSKTAAMEIEDRIVRTLARYAH